MRERNFAGCCVIVSCAYVALYAASTMLPGLLQSLFGYDALSAGLVMSPAGIFAVIAMPIVGRLLGKGVDARWLIAAGLLAMTAGNYWMSQLNLDISPGRRLVQGSGVLLAPRDWPWSLATGECRRLYPRRAARAAGRPSVFGLPGNEGGSVGTSLAQTFQERRDQFHTLCLGEYLDPFNAAANSPERATRDLPRMATFVGAANWRSGDVETCRRRSNCAELTN